MREQSFLFPSARQDQNSSRPPRLRSILTSLLAAGLACAFGLTSGIADAAQAGTATIQVEVVAANRPVDGAVVSSGSRSAATGASGIATLALPIGPASVVVNKEGYEPAATRVDVIADGDRAVRLVLTAKSAGQDPPTVVVSTRTRRGIDDQAVPIAVIGRDEIERNMLRTPGNIAGLLDGMSGLRVQTTSPELGWATVRIQGLRGQYTRLLSDGVPLYFDLPGGLAPAQIPPMDLASVEVITGAASALFGANAVAGVVNLLSRRPKEKDSEFLFSQSATGATDGVIWLSSPSTGSWSRTLLVSAHRQSEHDVDGDGWSDIPGYSRGVARQQVFWNNGRGRSGSGTARVTFEKREGGSASAHQSFESRGADGTLSAQMPFGRYVLAGAGMLFVQSRTRDFSDVRERERREAATIEIELRGTAPRQAWVAGIAADWFAIRTPGPLAAASIAPRGGVFIHDDVDVAPWLSLSGSARFDYTKGAGETLRIDDFLFSPRGSALVRGGPWAARVSAGRSYFVPTTHMDETEAAGLTRLSIESPLHLETARHVSADLTHTTGTSAVTVTVFDTHLDHPAQIDRATYTLRTAPGPLVARGVEVLGRVRRPPYALTGTYAFVEARESGGRDLALTPRHEAGLVATAASERRGRVDVQVQFTGAQRLDANPYRSTSEPYVVLGLLGEHRIGRWRLFVNAANLTDVRQTRWDPIARPARDVDGRWTVDAWAPLAGRVINGGIRISF